MAKDWRSQGEKRKNLTNSSHTARAPKAKLLDEILAHLIFFAIQNQAFILGENDKAQVLFFIFYLQYIVISFLGVVLAWLQRLVGGLFAVRYGPL